MSLSFSSLAFLCLAILLLGIGDAGAKEIALDNGNVTFTVPDDFTPLTQAEIVKRFPLRSGTMDAVGSADRNACISYALTRAGLHPEQLTEAKNAMTVTYNRLMPAPKWIRNDFININGTDWILFDSVLTTGESDSIHNVEILTSYRGVILDFKASASANLYDSVHDKLWACLNSIKLQDNATTRQPLARMAAAPSTPYEEVARGDMALKANHLDTAVEAYNAALLMDPQLSDAHIGLAKVSYEQGKLKDAIENYSTALSDDPTSEKAWRGRAAVEAELGDFDDAATDADKAIALKPNDEKGYNTRGLIETYRQNFDQARQDFNHSLDLVPNNSGAFLGRGRLSLIAGDYDQALADFQKGSFSDSVVSEMAILDIIKGKTDNALRNFKTEIDSAGPNRHSESSRLLTWELKAEQGHVADANQELSAYLDDNLQPKRDWARNIGAYLLDKKSEADFLTTAQADDSFEGKVQQGAAWYFVGVKRQLAGNSADAADAFRKCVDLDFKFTGYYLLARARLPNGDSGSFLAGPLRALGLSNEKASLLAVIAVGTGMLLSFIVLVIVAIVITSRGKPAPAPKTNISRAPPLKK